MKRLTVTGAVLGTIFGSSFLPGCKQDAGPAGGPGGFVPGQRAAERAVARLFELIQLEERDRIFGSIDEAYQPILESLQTLDEPRERLIQALTDTSNNDLALLLFRKRLTSAPELVEIAVGPVKQVDFRPEATKASVKLELQVPNGGRKEAWTTVYRKGVSWRVNVPLAYSADGKTTGPSPEQILGDVKKAVSDLKQVMEDLTKRLEAGEMVEPFEIREKLTAAGRPLGAAMQNILYGQTNIR